jgi:hypothetical protein
VAVIAVVLKSPSFGEPVITSDDGSVIGRNREIILMLLERPDIGGRGRLVGWLQTRLSPAVGVPVNIYMGQPVVRYCHARRVHATASLDVINGSSMLSLTQSRLTRPPPRDALIGIITK